ncbi:unnamed protein product [Phytophthora fragariaefolia]|uniref:Unnamed protein product n=1 Tax=Phytophthora fragariaefolia TaxID=1490495 RepID=A0A9W7D987_9STRA|nr:unnamed protein product [Phytophthora fragariaefolia]
MTVNALLVQGATSEFLLGEDWMLQQGVKIDFVSCEMKWYADDVRKVVTFWCAKDERRARPAKVRLDRRARVLMNLYGRTVELPAKEKLGTWTPTGDEMTVLAEEGDLDRDRVRQWLADIQRDAGPLSNEEELNIGGMSTEDKELLLQLIRIYPALLEPREGCPPPTTLGVEHEIHTGTEAPIKVRPHRHALEEQRVIDENVEEMLAGGVIEESHGAWGSPWS